MIRPIRVTSVALMKRPFSCPPASPQRLSSVMGLHGVPVPCSVGAFGPAPGTPGTPGSPYSVRPGVLIVQDPIYVYGPSMWIARRNWFVVVQVLELHVVAVHATGSR